MDHLSGAPNLGGRTVDADGVAHTQVDVREVLQAGAAVTGTLPARGVLAGYELEAFRGGEITAELEVFDRGGPVGLAFYGPRTTTGLWDSALTESDGKTPGLVSITTEPLPTAGTYLVLVWAEDRDADARFELRLSCKGNCGAPQCPNLEPCDLVCDFGFVLDAEACRTCACQDAPQCGEGVGECGDGLICGDDGRQNGPLAGGGGVGPGAWPRPHTVGQVRRRHPHRPARDRGACSAGRAARDRNRIEGRHSARRRPGELTRRTGATAAAGGQAHRAARTPCAARRASVMARSAATTAVARAPHPPPRVHLRGRARVRHAGPDLAQRLRRRGRRPGWSNTTAAA